ncbi:hypothetical protein RDABS01_005516 [Bienertia sinuspersici]
MDQEGAKEGYGEVERVDKKKAEGDREDAQSDDNQDEAEIEWQDEGKEEEEAWIELSLVGKKWTNKNINTNAFMTTIKSICQPKHGVGISNIGKNQFIFQFYHWRDKLRVWEDQPWHFDRHALILGEVDGNSKPSDIDLHEIPMWVRIYNLPIKGRLNPTNVVNMGNKIGSFIKMDQSGCGGIDKSIQIRVSIDVRKPLKKKIRIKMRGGVEENFDVKYEKSPLVCFHRGKLGHGLKDCEDCKDDETPISKYDGGLKASPWKARKDNDDQNMGGNPTGCAKKLFVLKPRREEEKVAKEQICEVVNRLGGVVINSTQEEMPIATVDINGRTPTIALWGRKIMRGIHFSI